MADDLATVGAVYETAGIEMTDEARRSLASYVEEHPRGRHGRLNYDLEGDFDLDSNAARDRFGFYYDRFGISRED
jgi:hypothetical protein